MIRFVRLICVLCGTVSLFCAVPESLGQSAASPETPQNGVVLIKLSEPIYPPLARQTRIAGDVDLMLRVKPDGSVESTTVLQGHPLLQQAALDSVQKSQFECRKCDEAASIQLVYTFQLVEPDPCCTSTADLSKNDQAAQPIPRVIHSQNHVTVIDRVGCICDPTASTSKVRSLKCLFLWHCRSLPHQ